MTLGRHHHHVPGSFLCTAGGFPRRRGVVDGQIVPRCGLSEGSVWNRTPDVGRAAEISTSGRNYRLWPGETPSESNIKVENMQTRERAKPGDLVGDGDWEFPLPHLLRAPAASAPCDSCALVPYPRAEWHCSSCSERVCLCVCVFFYNSSCLSMALTKKKTGVSGVLCDLQVLLSRHAVMS